MNRYYFAAYTFVLLHLFEFIQWFEGRGRKFSYWAKTEITLAETMDWTASLSEADIEWKQNRVFLESLDLEIQGLQIRCSGF